MSPQSGAFSGCRLVLADSAPRLQCPDGQILALASSDAVLLAWLALEGPTPRGRLAALLWPDKDTAIARNALRQRLFRLRRSTAHPLLAGTSVLALHPDVEHDLHGSGSVLGMMQVRLHSEIDSWLTAQRASRQASIQLGMEARIEALEVTGDYAQALALALTSLQANPHSEDAHRRVIRLHYLRGDRAAALLAFDRCEHMLKHEVSTAPSLETLELLATIEKQDAVDRGSASTGRVPLALHRPHRLIGRDEHIAELRLAWHAGLHVLLMGLPGAGRTRLLDWLAQHEPGLLWVAPSEYGAAALSTARRIAQAVVRRAGGRISANLGRALDGLLTAGGADTPSGGPGASGAAAPAAGELAAPWAEPLGELLRVSGLDVLAVDDVDRADPVSQALIEAVIDRSPVRWCLSLPFAPPGSAARELRARLQAGGHCAEIGMRWLELAQIEQLLASLGLEGLPRPAIPAAAAELRRLTGGHPRLLLEALRLAWRSHGRASWSPLASAETAALSARAGPLLAALSPPALDLARLAAVAGPSFSPDLASAVLERPTLALADAWGELERARLFEGGAIVSQIVLEALRASVPAPLIAQLQARIAQAAADLDHRGR